MASFVREVLSAAGTLDEKEDFAGKAIKIQKKLTDLKSQLAVRLEKKHGEYGGSGVVLASAGDVTGQMERIAAEIQSLDATINKHFRAELLDRNKELLELNDAMQELNLTLQIVEKIKQCRDLLESVNEDLYSGKLYPASNSMKLILKILQTPCSSLDESTLKIFPSIKKELAFQKLQLTKKLKDKWQNMVKIEVKENSKDRTRTTSLIVNVGLNTRPEFQDLIQALHATDILHDVLEPFMKSLRLEFFEALIKGVARADGNPDNTFKLKLPLNSPSTMEKSQGPLDVIQNLMIFFAFLFKQFSIPLAENVEGENEVSLQEVFGEKLSTWFCNAMIKDVLAPAVPNSVDLLPAYQDIVDKTEVLHEYLVNNKFLAATNMTLLNYARNVDALFANKVCQDLLTKAREIMKEDMFTTVDMEPGSCDQSDLLNRKVDDHHDLPIPPNFSVPEKIFQFPKCKISQSTLKVLELAQNGLDIAAKSKPFCSIRMFHTVRNVFELWSAVVPTFHKSNLESLPQLAAIAHNSTMYLAHRLISLGFLYKDKLPAMSQHTPTFVDIVPRLRSVAGAIMVQSLRKQRDTINSILAGSGISGSSTSGGGSASSGSGVGGERRLSSGVDQAVRQFISQLNHNQKVWQGTLPDDVYYRSIGSLLNAGLEEIIQKILGLTDISAEMSGQFCSLFNQIVTKTPDLFKPASSPDKYVRKWAKFKELIIVLDSSLRVLEDRWAEGSGPLAKEMTADEVKQMIRALFQNTERRAAVLSKIK